MRNDHGLGVPHLPHLTAPPEGREAVIAALRGLVARVNGGYPGAAPCLPEDHDPVER